MPHVAGAIHHLAGFPVANVYVLDGGPGNRFLIDCGHVLERPWLVRGLRRLGLGPRDLAGVLLTHRHSDHAGNARFLAQHGVRVYAHQADADVLARAAPRPLLSRRTGPFLAGVFAEIENRFPAPRVFADRALAPGDTIAGLEVHWVPGHTEGSLLYRHAETKALLSGDTILSAHPPLVRRLGIVTAYPDYTWNLASARAAIAAFHATSLAYEHLLPGHGPPIVGGARGKVLAAIAEGA